MNMNKSFGFCSIANNICQYNPCSYGCQPIGSSFSCQCPHGYVIAQGG